MSICENVTRQELYANFGEVASAITDDLRTVIVGLDYAAYIHDVTDGTNSLGTYDESSSNVVAWPTLGSGEVVDLTEVKVFVYDALLRFFDDVVASPGAAQGTVLTSPNVIQHDGGDTVWAGANRSGTVATNVLVGDIVRLTSDDSGGNAFITTVSGFEVVSNELVGLVLADNVPAALGVEFNVEVFQSLASHQLSATDFTAAAADLTVNASISVNTDRLPSGGDLIGAPEYSQLYVDYRALRDTNVGQVITVSHVSELDDYFVGWSHPLSGLGFAMFAALAPADPEVRDAPVLGAAVASDQASDWHEGLERVQNITTWYTLVPLTLDPAVHQMVEDLLDTRQTIGLVSAAFVAQELSEETILFSGNESVTISGSNDEVVTATNPIFADAQVGDLVTTDDGEYPIVSRQSNQTVTLSSSVTSATEVTQVTHLLTTSEQVEEYGDRAQAFANRGIRLLFPDQPTWDGSTVPSYLLAAAVGGLRGYAPAQQPLTKVQLHSPWGVPQASGRFRGSLRILRDLGVFVVGPGSTIVLYDATTDQSVTEDRSESTVANVDAIRRYVESLVNCYRGRARLTSDRLLRITNHVRTSLSAANRDSDLGSELGALYQAVVVGRARQSTVNADDVVLPVEVSVAVGIRDTSVAFTIALSTGE